MEQSFVSMQPSIFGYYKPNPLAILRMFCFPYAGAGIYTYRKWAARLPGQVEVCPLLLPGRSHRIHEQPLSDCAALVEKLATEIEPYTEKPFVFFGHSMGALLSFEVARSLRRRNSRQPSHLFVSGRAAPQLPRRPGSISDLPEDEFLLELRSLNGTPPEVFEHSELLKAALPVLRADFSIVETYSYQDESPLSDPITVYGGHGDTIRPEDLQAWNQQTSNTFELQMFMGGHFFINTSQNVFLEMLSHRLEMILANGRS